MKVNFWARNFFFLLRSIYLTWSIRNNLCSQCVKNHRNLICTKKIRESTGDHNLHENALVKKDTQVSGQYYTKF